MTTTRRSFGKRIKQLRREKGYTQEQLADRAGLHRTYIGSIERGEQNISLDNIDKIARALSTNITELFK